MKVITLVNLETWQKQQGKRYKRRSPGDSFQEVPMWLTAFPAFVCVHSDVAENNAFKIYLIEKLAIKPKHTNTIELSDTHQGNSPLVFSHNEV